MNSPTYVPPKLLLIFPKSGYIKRFVGRACDDVAHTSEPQQLGAIKNTLNHYRLFGKDGLAQKA